MHYNAKCLYVAWQGSVTLEKMVLQSEEILSGKTVQLKHNVSSTALGMQTVTRYVLDMHT